MLEVGVGYEHWTSVELPEENLSGQAARLHQCVDGDATHCFRATDGEAIEESVDGGDSWSRIWQFDSRSADTRRRIGYSSSNYWSASIVDLAVGADGTLAVSVTMLADPIVRRPDGSWSRDERWFRALPTALVVQVFVGGLMIALACLAAGHAAPGSRGARPFQFPVVAGLIAIVVLSLVCDMYRSAHEDYGAIFFALLFVPALIVATGWYLLRVHRVTRFPVWAWLVAALAISLLAPLSMIPLLLWWANDMIGASLAQDLGLGITVVLPLFAGALTVALSRWVSFARSYWPPPPPGWRAPARTPLPDLLSAFGVSVTVPLAAAAVATGLLPGIGRLEIRDLLLLLAPFALVIWNQLARRRQASPTVDPHGTEPAEGSADEDAHLPRN